MDGLPDERSFPTLFIVLLAIGVGVAWLLAVIFIGAVFFAGGAANPLTNILPPSLEPGLRWAMTLQYSVTGLTLLVILSLGSVVLIQIGNRSSGKAAATAQLMIRMLIGLTLAGFLMTLGTPLAISGSVLSVVPNLLTALPATAVQVGVLVLADHYLRPPDPGVF